jgi:hypothetical protein
MAGLGEHNAEIGYGNREADRSKTLAGGADYPILNVLTCRLQGDPQMAA